MRVLLEFQQNAGQYSIGIAKHVTIPKADHSVAEAVESFIPSEITFRRMLAAIDFDDQAAFNAAKIHHIRAESPLTFELKTGEPAIPNA